VAPKMQLSNTGHLKLKRVFLGQLKEAKIIFSIGLIAWTFKRAAADRAPI